MNVTLKPVTENLQKVIKNHGAAGWVVLRNDTACCQRGGQQASLVVKDNKMVWVTSKEIETK